MIGADAIVGMFLKIYMSYINLNLCFNQSDSLFKSFEINMRIDVKRHIWPPRYSARFCEHPGIIPFLHFVRKRKKSRSFLYLTLLQSKATESIIVVVLCITWQKQDTPFGCCVFPVALRTTLSSFALSLNTAGLVSSDTDVSPAQVSELRRAPGSDSCKNVAIQTPALADSI